MDAFVAMQIESLMVFSFVIAAFILRFIIVQWAFCLHHKSHYEYQINLRIAAETTAKALSQQTEPIAISPVQLAFPQTLPGYSVV